MFSRDPNAHKGDNGKVMIIGGSARYYGAPILCALGAEAVGVDLIYPFLPPEHLEAAKHRSLNFILHSFKKSALGLSDVDAILKLSHRVDVVVIGPGIEPEKKTIAALKQIFSELKRPTVIDAGALFFTHTLPAISVLTPHRGEFKKLTGDDPTPENVQKWATELNATILCKGPVDIIADKETIALNETGNAGMTVGGTGDVLAGIVAGLMAQKNNPITACETAANIWGLCAENLIHLQDSFTAQELLTTLPQILHKYK